MARSVNGMKSNMGINFETSQPVKLIPLRDNRVFVMADLTKDELDYLIDHLDREYIETQKSQL